MEETIYFTILASVAIISGLLTITRTHPLSAALCLVMTLISMAGLYALLSADFLFIIQILVYAGAIMALVVFVIMLLNVKLTDFPPEPHQNRNVLVALAFLAPVFLVVQQVLEHAFGQTMFPTVPASYGTIKAVGLNLYASYYFPFELVSVLLLVALVGVVTLAKRRI